VVDTEIGRMAATKTAGAEADTAQGGRLTSVKSFLVAQLALIRGAFLLVLGLALVAFVAKVLDLSNGSLLAIAFLCPLLAYLILTGQLTEFGAGGVTAKFREAARKSLASSVQRIAVEDTQTIEKLGPEQFERIQGLERGAPIVLTLVLGARGDRYRADALRQYLALLSDLPRFKLVVLLDPDGRAVGYLPADTVKDMLKTNTTSKPLIDAINAGHLPGLAALRIEFLGIETTVEKALQRMTDLRAETMPVRDNDLRLAGVVEREDVLARFLLDATRG
jgi:hypothetical protein